MKNNVFVKYLIAFLLTLTGGFIDAYTYIFRGALFANMQTGNLVKFFINLSNAKFELTTLLPILFFLLGIIISCLINRKKDRSIVILFILLIVSLLVSFLPQSDIYNSIAICALSITGAMQFESFRYALKNVYTSTMCTNNMRLFMESTITFFSSKKDKSFLFYFLIIICFSLGIVSSTLLGKLMNTYTTIISSIVYLVIIILYLTFKIQKEEIVE